MPTPPPQYPGDPGRRGRGPVPPPDPATRRLPRPGGPEAPTEQIRARYRPPESAATEKIARPRPSAPPPPPLPRQEIRREEPQSPPRRRRVPTAVLVAVIVVGAIVAALAGAELYARHRAGVVLADVTRCLVQDDATVSFGVNPPFLWQHITGHYTNISVQTGGHQVQSARGMTADVDLSDIRLHGNAESQGSIGSLTATLSWTAAGIKDTVADNLPGVGALVTGVSTDPGAGSISIEAVGDTKITAQPVVDDGNLDLHVLDVSGPFDKDTVQTALNTLTDKLNDNFPLGIHADSVTVTDTGVVGKFSSQDASIPQGESDECFAQI